LFRVFIEREEDEDAYYAAAGCIEQDEMSNGPGPFYS
jgi:hypothetical protein